MRHYQAIMRQTVPHRVKIGRWYILGRKRSLKLAFKCPCLAYDKGIKKPLELDSKGFVLN